MPTINDLRQQAATIKNATQVGENTANRVGTTFETIADLLESMGGVANLSTIDIGSIDTLNTTGDMLVGTPNIYTLTMTRGSNTFKVGTLFQFANNGRYDVAQVIVSQYIIDSDGRIDTTSADQEVHIFYRLCKTMNGGSLPTPIGTWTTWTELGGSGGSGVTIDPYPTQSSGNAVSSGGVFERLQEVAPKVDISEIDDIDEYSDMLATKPAFYTVTTTLARNVFRIGTLMEFANQGRYILYQILATDYVLNEDGTLNTTLSENGGLKLIWRMKQFSSNPPEGVTIGEWSKWSYLSGGGDSGYQPNNEDIDLNASDQLQFANKLYDASAFSGLGRVYLRKNIVELNLTDKYFDGFVSNVLVQDVGTSSIPDAICFDTKRKMFVARVGLSWYLYWSSDEDYNPITRDVNWNYNGNFYRWNGKELAQWDKTINQLTQAMVNTANTVYHIQYDYDLNGQTITLPTGCVLEFEGGSVKNGTLSGKLITKGGFDFANIGCVYNDSSYASHNTQCLAILSGLDDVEINLSNTIHFAGTNSSVFNGLSLHGHGNYILLNSCSLFKSYGNLSFDNVKVIATRNASEFARLEDGIGFANVTFDGCYFEGNLRVFGCIRYATESFDRGIEKLLVNNCEFKEITCLNGGVSNIIFMISDTNYKSAVITNNIIHNFYSEFFGFVITNSSVYEGYISAFASKEQRDLLISNNYVYNDLDYKPWESVSGYNAYFAFVVAEQGNCDYGDNVVKNIIGNNSNEAVYDAYFSVSNLIYHGNTIENCLNLTGAYNELLKGKGGYGNRIYTNNKFKTTDLSDAFDGTINTSVMLHFTQYSRKKMFVLQDNVFEIYQLNINYSYTYDYEKLQILGNIIKVQEALANNNLASFFNPSIDSSEINVENNIIDVQSITLSSGTSGICVAGLRSAGIKVNISNNTLRNVCLLGANANSSYNYVGTANNNHLTYDEQNFNIRNILANYSSGLQYHNNYVEIIAGGFTNTELFTYINRPVEADCRIAIKKKFSGSNPLGCFYKILSDSDVTYNIVAKYHERNSDFKLISEENYIFADSQGSYYGYEINGNIQSWNSGNVSLFSFSDATTHLRYIQARGAELRSFVYSGDVIDYELKITKAKSSDVLNYHPTQGVSTKRPTLTINDKGAKYFDTSIGYSISWDGNKWVDSDGFSANLKKGLTTQRPSPAAEDAGFQYYDSTLKKMILWDGTAWTNLDGTALA